MLTIYNDGWNAYCDWQAVNFVGIPNNPHPVGSWERHNWDNGFYDAMYRRK